MSGDNHSWVTVINQLPIEIVGVIMAMIISVLRVIYDKEETKPMRIILEALICGALSLTVSSAVVALGLDSHWSVFAGGVIGYFGSTTVRSLSIKILNTKIKKD